MKKIDAHGHLGEIGGWANVKIDLNGLISQMDKYEIEKTILCATDSTENKRVLDAYKKYSNRIIPLFYGNPMEGAKRLEECEVYLRDKDFKGIKLQPLKHAYVADSEIVDPYMKLAEKYNVPVFIHSGHAPYSLPWSIALVAERFPNVKVVMIHMGHGHGVYIDAALKMARRFSNIYLEMSGMPMSSKIKEAYETVGKDRIMFGTDTPFHHPSVEMQKVITSGLDDEALEDVFYKNAAKLMEV